MFSIVIPLYNKAPHIADALRSVLAQTFAPAEIIVVDDGSTDGGAEIVRQFLGEKIILVRQNNAGVSAARNIGASRATCGYVAFLDADDAWRPEHLQTLKELITRFPGLGLYSTLYEIHLHRRIFAPHSAYPPGFFGVVDDFFARMATGLSLALPSTACVARPALQDIGGFPEAMKRGEDLVVWFKLSAKFGMAHAARVTVINKRDAVNRSILIREPGPPAALLYLLNLLAPGLPAKQCASIKKLFRRMAFFTAAGMREAGDNAGAGAIMRLAAGTRMFGLAAKIFLLMAAPPAALTFGRRFRHQGSLRQI
jgi:glycosyltransferase involved in cell wall biosynthesis